MSKKKQQYEHALNQIMDFLEFSFQVNTHLSPQEILNEIESLEGLKGIKFEFVISDDHPVGPGIPYFYMIQEEFVRNDTVLPDLVQMWKLPADSSPLKEIHQIIRLQPVIW
jgi:hypothetical protein